MPCASAKIMMAEMSGSVGEQVNIIVFDYVNSILYTANNIHTKVGMLLKVFNIFCSET